MHCFHKLKETTRPSWKNKNKQVSSQPSPRRSGFWIAKNSSFTLQPASLGYVRLSINPSSQFFSACQEDSLLPKKKKKLKKWRETCESPSKTTPRLTSLPRPPPPAPPIHTLHLCFKTSNATLNSYIILTQCFLPPLPPFKSLGLQ